jgi:hypothetical protein
MEPIRAHEVICNSSLVHDWRVAQLTRLGIPTPLAKAVCSRRRLASGRRVGSPRLPAPACLAHCPMKKDGVSRKGHTGPRANLDERSRMACGGRT